jgi:DNA mismatch endonuclease (patch repair protein)
MLPDPPSARRSANMRAVRSKNTKPEMIVRRLVHRLGYRFRLHRRDLPGNPDLAFPGRRKVIFVHGCFWHRHNGCKRATLPQSNGAFWGEKLRRNVERDAEQLEALTERGWKPLVIWECQTQDEPALTACVRSFLSDGC